MFKNGTAEHVKKPVSNGRDQSIDIQQDKEEMFHYDVFDNPPFILTLGFAFQVTYLSYIVFITLGFAFQVTYLSYIMFITLEFAFEVTYLSYIMFIKSVLVCL